MEGEIAGAKEVEEVFAEQISPVRSSDVYAGDNVQYRKSLKQDTGYPRNLTENQIVRLIYFFGARKMAAKSFGGKVSKELSPLEKRAVDEFFKILGFTYKDKGDFLTAYKSLTQVFREVITFLRQRPAFLTKAIYDACKQCGYQSVVRNVVMVMDKHGNVVPRLAIREDKQKLVPIGNVENLLWELQNVTLDKMMMIAQSIKMSDVQKANLGMKSKAFRDLFAAFHMARLQQKNPNLTLVSVNVNTADGNEKLRVFSSYIQKNREEG